MKTILVTGSSGYIGSHLIQGLLKQYPNDQIYGLSLPGTTNSAKQGWISIDSDILNPNLPHIMTDLKPTMIFHAIGVGRDTGLRHQLQLHVEGTQHLLQSLVDSHLKPRVVMLGSAAEYGPYPFPVDETAQTQPSNEYGVAKLSQSLVAQLYYRKYQIPIITGRIFNAYGNSPEQFVIGSMAKQIAILEDQPLTTNTVIAQNLKSKRDFIHIHDIVTGLIALAKAGQAGETYNLASGHSVSMQWVLETLLKQSHLKEYKILAQGAQFSDVSQGVISKIKSHTGWEPMIDIETGLKSELQFWRQQIALKSIATQQETAIKIHS